MMNRGQVWVETVIYTLIGLTIIGIVLGLVTPRINEYRDRAVIDQTLNSLEAFDSTIQEVIDQGPGNVRIIEFTMKRGGLVFDEDNDEIRFTLEDSDVVYSEPDVSVAVGRIDVLTTEGPNSNVVVLTLSYPHDLIVNGTGQYEAVSIPYRFSVRNDGIVGGVTQLTLMDVS